MTTNDMLAPFPVRPENCKFLRTAFWFYEKKDRLRLPRHQGLVAWLKYMVRVGRYVDGWGLQLQGGAIIVTHTKDDKD